MPSPDLRALPPTLRVLCAGFLISLALAYAVALLFIFVQSGMTPKGISAQYRGNADDTPVGNPPVDEALGAPAGAKAGAPTGESPETEGGEDGGVPSLRHEWKARDQDMKFPKPLKEMILTTHLHMLSISGILFLVGGIFAFSSFPERIKSWIIITGFAGLALDYACMWGVRYAGGAFAAGVFVFGFVQSLSLAVQMAASLKDLLLGGKAASRVRS
jgi:hypothetical protein